MKTGNCTFVEGYTSGGAVCFHAEISGRNIGVVVPQDTLKRLAEILKHTNHVGHAAWHLNSPDSPLPCSTCDHQWQATEAANVPA